MKKSLRPVLLVLIVFAGVMAFTMRGRTGAGGDDKIPWRHDFNAARQEALSAHKPVLAYFTATWCGPCQEMHRTTWADPKVESALRDYVPIKIDVDENSKVAAQYHVEGIPAYMILDDQGTAIRQGEGLRSSDEFLEWLRAR